MNRQLLSLNLNVTMPVYVYATRHTPYALWSNVCFVLFDESDHWSRNSNALMGPVWKWGKISISISCFWCNRRKNIYSSIHKHAFRTLGVGLFRKWVWMYMWFRSNGFGIKKSQYSMSFDETLRYVLVNVENNVVW